MTDSPSDNNPRQNARALKCRWGLYPIIDAEMSGRSHAEICQELVDAGVRVVQLRDKKATFEELMEIGAELRRITREANVTLIVNDNPYLAREIDADGVHIGQDDFPPDIVREVVGPGRIVGLSTHSKQQAIAATSWPIDYIGVGPIYTTTSKVSKNRPVGPSLIRWIKQHIPLPTVAVGGISAETIPDVLAAGASNVAMISEIMRAEDIRSHTEELRKLTEMYVDWK